MHWKPGTGYNSVVDEPLPVYSKPQFQQWGDKSGTHSLLHFDIMPCVKALRKGFISCQELQMCSFLQSCKARLGCLDAGNDFHHVGGFAQMWKPMWHNVGGCESQGYFSCSSRWQNFSLFFYTPIHQFDVAFNLRSGECCELDHSCSWQLEVLLNTHIRGWEKWETVTALHLLLVFWSIFNCCYLQLHCLMVNRDHWIVVLRKLQVKDMSCFCCSSQIVTIRFPEVKNHIWSWSFFIMSSVAWSSRV